MQGQAETDNAGGSKRRVITMRLVMIGVTLAIGILGIAALQDNIAGQFHDDAMYMAAAKSMAEGDGYRVISVPTMPAQTKYPPLYSHVLSLVWRVAPSFPENLFWLKMVSVAFLMGIVTLTGAFYRRYSGRMGVGAVACSFLVGANMLVFPFVDYTLTELPFLLLCLAAYVVAAPRAPGTEHHWRHAALLGAIAGSAFLIRQAAVPLIAAGMIYLWPRDRRRHLPLYLAIVGLLSGPWLFFKLAHAGEVTHSLLQYYVAYEESVPALALADPAAAVQIVLANILYVGQAVDLALIQLFTPGLRPFVYALVLWGLWLIVRRRPGFLLVFLPLYIALILLWPWQPARYSMPLVPVIVLAFVLGTESAVRAVAAIVTPRAARRVLQGLTAMPLLLVMVMSCGWLANFLEPVPDKTRVAFSAWLDYSWEGFEETFAWIDEHTEPDALLAGPFDPMYYLYTGRRGVRPWYHRPHTYFYPLGNPQPRMGPADDVRRELIELGVAYMIINPLEGYEEREEAEALLHEVLAGYPQPPQLLFISTDGLHRVYRLPEPEPSPSERSPSEPSTSEGAPVPSTTQPDTSP